MPFSPINTRLVINDGLPPEAAKSLALTIVQDRDAGIHLLADWHGLPWDPTDGPPLRLSTRAGEFPGVDIDEAHATESDWDSTTLSGKTRFSATAVRLTFGQLEAGKRGVVVLYLTGLNFISAGTRPIHLVGTQHPWQVALLAPTMETQAELGQYGACRITATLCSPQSDISMGVDPLLQEARELAELLSFGHGRQVSLARLDRVAEDGRLLESVLFETPPAIFTDSGPLPFGDLNLRNGVVPFIRHALPKLRVEEANYRLKALLHASVLARGTHVIEVRALLLANLLEILRYSFGHNVLVTSGRARAQGDDIHYLPATNNGRKMAFAELLQAACSEIGLAGWDPLYTRIRNSIVHQGVVLGATINDQVENVNRLSQFTDRVVLALLDGDGAGLSYFRTHSSDFAPFQRATP